METGSTASFMDRSRTFMQVNDHRVPFTPLPTPKSLSPVAGFLNEAVSTQVQPHKPGLGKLYSSILRRLPKVAADLPCLRTPREFPAASLTAPLKPEDARKVTNEELGETVVDVTQTAALRSLQKESLLYSWMFVFPLPNAVTPEQQQDFAQEIERRSTTSVEVVEHAFSFIDPGGVREVMQTEVHYSQTPRPLRCGGSPLRRHTTTSSLAFTNKISEVAGDKLSFGQEGQMTGTLTSHAQSSMSPGSARASTFLDRPQQSKAEPEDSLQRALQCSIELTLAFFQSFDTALKKAFAQMRPQDQLKADTHANFSYTSSENEKHQQHVQKRGMPDRKLVNIMTFTSKNKDKIYICVRLDREVAEVLADLTEYPVQLSKKGVEKLGVKLSDPDTVPCYAKYDEFFRDLCSEHPDPFEEGAPTVLRPIDRIRLLYDKVTDSLDIMHLMKFGLMSDNLPLHHRAQLAVLRQEWGNFWLVFCLYQPLELVRDYFGEEIAFYFVLLHELVWATACLSVASIICGAWSYFSSAADTQARCVMSFIIMVWFRCFTKSWERTEAQFAIKWGLDQHASSTVKHLRNHRFIGEMMVSDENELEMTPQVPPNQQIIGRVLSALLTVSFVLLVIVGNALELYIFSLLCQRFTSARAQSFLSGAMGCLSGVQIKVIDSLWDGVSNRITDLEHRAEDADYQWSKSIKTSTVRFINTVSSMLFFAFVRPLLDMDNCEEQADSCLDYYRHSLTMKVAGVFVVRFFLLGAINDVVKPYIHLKMRHWQSKKEHMEYAEKQDQMDTYECNDLTDDYLDVVLPVSFIVFFGMINPFLCLLLIPVLLIQVRADAWKLVHVYRRPYPRIASGIGCFNAMFGFFGHFMIASNLGLMVIQLGGVAKVFPAFGLAPTHIVGMSGMTADRSYLITDKEVILTLAIMLILLWHLFGFAVPSTSFHVLLEERRHNRQRHNLFYNAGCRGVNAKVKVSPDKLGTRKDFSHTEGFQ